MIVIAYLALPAVFFVLWFIDLWAKGYDLPDAQRRAKAALCFVVALALVFGVRVVALAVGSADGRILLWLAWATGLPVLGALASAAAYREIPSVRLAQIKMELESWGPGRPFPE